MKPTIAIIAFLFTNSMLQAEDGYKLWLRYNIVDNSSRLQQYRQNIREVVLYGNSPTEEIVKTELELGLAGLLGTRIPFSRSIQKNGTLLIGTAATVARLVPGMEKELAKIGAEGFIIQSKTVQGKNCIIITAHSGPGLLYGVFHFLRLLQTQEPIYSLKLTSTPLIQLRLLNHWDNLDRSVERGYAGMSIWNWHTLPDYIDNRYIDYARANASIGINGTVITNVNANAHILTTPYLEKVAALANIFRPYGIKIYLTARFSAPIEIGGLKTADPLNDSVRQWWKDKAKEIYALVPDFGGFLVKANSEGQPGPQNYGRDHAQGANMLAQAVAPFGGLVMWRAFVYSQQSDDRFKQAYEEFKPLDGKFDSNILVQVKNGPIDFQPREPFSPLFGAMPQTPLMMEFQITQEYLGQATHLVYQAPLYKEVLEARINPGSNNHTVASVIDGSTSRYALTGMAGVSNIGNDRNWTGHLFGQSNWYAFGRLAWDHNLSSDKIADEWIRQTFSNNSAFITSVRKIMLSSRENLVNYMTPLGLHHIMGNGHHYGPAPWSNNLPRPDWNPVYYHNADSNGIGFNRTATGSNALAQYQPGVRKLFEDSATCDEGYLLWFHHVSWKHVMRSGRILWDELCHKYNEGVDSVRAMQQKWKGLKKWIDKERFQHVSMLLAIQLKEAIWWRDACLLYFQSFSGMPIPAKYEKPSRTLEWYKQLRFPYAPGI